jgi:hypothetical protein
MSKSRKAVTLVEMMITFVIALVIYAVATSTWVTGLKMGKSAQVAVAVSSIALLENLLVEDLLQLGVDRVREVLLCRGDRIGFYRGSFTPGVGGPILLEPVVYDFQSTQNGNFLLRRRMGKESPRTIPGVVLRQPRFDLIPVVAGTVLRLTATVLENDEPPSPIAANTVRSVPLVLMLPIPVPQGPGNWGLKTAVRLQIINGPLAL